MTDREIQICISRSSARLARRQIARITARQRVLHTNESSRTLARYNAMLERSLAELKQLGATESEDDA